MTGDQLLAEMREGARPSGICIRMEWTWVLRGELVTRAVNTLIRKKLAHAGYYLNGRAGLDLTDEGRGK